MISASNLLSLALLYVCALFAIAWYADRNKTMGPGRWPGVVYALTLAVYCSSWTFYGAVGSSTDNPWSHSPIYLGPILMLVLGWPLIKRLMAVGAHHRVTSIADLISARFGKRQSLAVIVTLVATAAVLPYIALQFKALAQAWIIVGGSVENLEAIGADAALLAALILAIFTVLFGTRRLNSRERHQGVMAAIAVESLIKLLAFATVAALAIVYLLDLPASEWPKSTQGVSQGVQLNPEFFAQMLISALAIFCLPRQFHVMVVEASSLQQTKTARWLFPLYLLLFMLLVVPISMAGSHLYASTPNVNPDTFTQLIPITLGSNLVTAAAFIGGISAATSMVIVATISLAIMITNEIITPMVMANNARSPEAVLKLGDALRRIRQAVIVLILLAAWLVDRQLSNIPWLAQIGYISFLAAGQLAPGLIAGIYWRGANGLAVTAGLVVGVFFWFYCGILPAILPAESLLMSQGPLAIEWLRPAQLLGFSSDHQLAYALAWSLGVNTLVMLVGSRLLGPSASDQRQAELFIKPFTDNSPEEVSDLELSLIRVSQLQVLLQPFVREQEYQNLWLELEDTNQERLLPGDRAPQFVVNRVELVLASIIGASSAHKAIEQLENSQQLEFFDLASIVSDANKRQTYNRELLQTTVEHLAQGISVIDQDLRLVAWNSHYEELFDYPARFLYVGCPIERVYRFNAERGYLRTISQDSIDDDVQRRLAWLREGNPHRLERELPNGKVIDIRGNPIPNGGFVTTYMDITDYREMVTQLEETQIELEAKVATDSEKISLTNAELRQENRLRAEVETRLREAHLSKSRFMSATSHDLLQPINAARLFNSALANRLNQNPDPELRNIVDQIDGSLRRAEQLIAELREIARLDSGRQPPRPSHFSLRELFEELEKEFSVVAANQQLNLRIHPTSAWLHTDRGLLYRVLQNLLSNAIRYTSSGGVLLSARRYKDRIKIQVWDTGQGIAEQDQVKIFEEFERGPHSNDVGDSGLGLGLSIVQRITNMLHIPLQLRSVVGKGSCFTIMVSKGHYQYIAKNNAQPQGDLSGLLILCLENDPMILKGMEQLLMSLGADVVTTRHRQAFNLAMNNQTPDLIIADYQLDDGDNGVDTVQDCLAERRLTIPCILISADDAAGTRDHARGAGFRFLPKPVNAARLRALILALTTSDES